MKICEYENIKCPSCQEEERLADMGIDSFEGNNIYVGLGPWHFLRCEKCQTEFAIPCQD